MPLDLLPVIRSSGILGDRQLADIKNKVLQGDYPLDSAALADCLVRDNMLDGVSGEAVLEQPAAGPDRRPVYHSRPRRLGLDGAGLPGAPRDDGPGGRAQDHRAGDLVERAGCRTVSARDEAGRAARPSQRGSCIRRRSDQQDLVHRHGIRGGLEPGRTGSRRRGRSRPPR